MINNLEIYFKIVEYRSDEYNNAVALREEILRKPLGLSFTEEELEQEKEHIHVVGFLDQNLCATLALVPEGDELRMQRVVTKSQLQNRGIGSAMMAFCLEYAKNNGHRSIYCYARATAIPFYIKNNYVLEGSPLMKDGLLHHKMRKAVS